MPSIKNTQKIIEKIKTTTEKGEITINLNLKVLIEGGEIKITGNTESVPEIKSIPNKKSASFIPDEQFELEIPVIHGFGKKV